MRFRWAAAGLAVLAVWATGAAMAAEGWGPYSAWQVRRTVEIPSADPKQPKMRGEDCVFVSFPTGEFLQPDGGDLRVTIGGKPAPFEVLDIAYGGRVSLVAGITAPATEMHVYYGNPAAKGPASDWVPHRGLWLSTHHYAGGECKTVQGMRDALAKSDRRYGASPVGQIFHGFNPFGPSDNYLSVYRGWLYLDKDTTITFAAIADDIGYLFVEDKLVAAKPEWGDMPQDKRFSGEPMFLKEGLHPIVMYHVEGTGNQAAGAAWWMPGMKRGEKFLHFAVIPPEAFAPIRYGKLADYEVRGQAVGADFSATNDGDVVLDDGSMLVRFVFRDMSRPANRALQCQPLWDFGDGTTSTSRDPNHVYLRPGDYTATLTLKSQTAAYPARQKIQAGAGYERVARREWDQLANYLPILKDYQFDKMSTEDLLVAANVAEELEAPAEIIAVGRLLFQRVDQVSEAVFVRHCLALGRALRDYKEEPKEGEPPRPEDQLKKEARERAEEAIRVFTRAEERTKDLASKARLANEKGDVYYYYLDDLEKAEREYTRTLTAYAKAADAQVRLAQIRIGDVYRTKGDYPAALGAYQRAAEMPIHDRTEGVEAARRGSFPRTVEDYTARKLFKEAHEALDEWSWEFPADKLIGYATLLRCRLALAEDKKGEAEKQAEELIRVNKTSEWADDLLLFLTDMHLAANEPDKALHAASRLLADHPASELQPQAHLRRVQIRLQKALYDDAAKEAIELADGGPDCPEAPKALLLAATAQARAKKTDDAAKTLERLTQKYPTTAEATAGLKMLKELRPR